MSDQENPDDLQNAMEVFSKDFNVELKDFTSDYGYQKLVKHISSVIAWYLDKDFNGLFTLFYRMDINEQKVKNILAYEEPGYIADMLAEVVLERELEKVRTRKKYSNTDKQKKLH